jgi:hypothetical protein
MLFTKPTMVDPRVALRGRETPILSGPTYHEVFGHPIDRVPEGAEVAYLGLGCFWGAEKLFWNTPGVLNTAVGYQGGYTPNPTYEEVCSGRTGHTEAVKVVFDPKRIDYAGILRIFFENHNPTQGYRQGNDRGRRAGGDRRQAAGPVPAGVRRGGLRPDHHRDRPGRDVLPGRGLPPAVFGEEPERLLPDPRHRGALRAGVIWCGATGVSTSSTGRARVSTSRPGSRQAGVRTE